MNKADVATYVRKIREGTASPENFNFYVAGGIQTESEAADAADRKKRKNWYSFSALALAFTVICALQIGFRDNPFLRDALAIPSFVLIAPIITVFSKVTEDKYVGTFALALFGVILFCTGILTRESIATFFENALASYASK